MPVPAVILTVWSGAVLVIPSVPAPVIGDPVIKMPVPPVAATLVTVPVLTPRLVLASAAVVAPVPPCAMSLTWLAIGPMKTSFVPAAKLTALPELLDERTVVRVSTDAEA